MVQTKLEAVARQRWVVYAAIALAWLAVRALQVHFTDWGVGNDVHLYHRYARLWGAGRAPYVDFHPEYPPGALPIFLLPYLVKGGGGYPSAFGWEMALFDLAVTFVVVSWGRRLLPESPGAPLWLGLLYLATTTLLFPVLYSRFDLVPGALLICALYAVSAGARHAWLGSLLLGIAGGVKLWPLSLTPLFWGLAFRRGGPRHAFLSALQITVGMVLTALLLLPRAGWHVLDFMRYHAARGIQIESTWSTFALMLSSLGGPEASPVHEYGAFHVRGSAGDLFAQLSIPALLALALLPQLLAFRGHLGREADDRGRVTLCAAAATVLGFMVGGKVLSPQYMLWLAPLLPLLSGLPSKTLGRGLLVTGMLVACGLTTLVYPYWSPALEQREPGHIEALVAVGTRNLLLVALYVFCTLRVARRSP